MEVLQSRAAAPTERRWAGRRRGEGYRDLFGAIEDEDFVPPSFPKGAGTRVLIEGAMSASSMFNNLSREQWRR